MSIYSVKLTFLNSGDLMVEPQYDEGPRFHCVDVLFHIFYYNCGEEYHLLYQGLQYEEVCDMGTPLILFNANAIFSFSLPQP